jgi:D-lactate dehydrogenase (cytochrome)
MASHRIRARAARGAGGPPKRLTRPEDLASYLADAAHTPGGHAPAVLLPSTEGEVAAAARTEAALLPVGAQSSLTGGATPFGTTVLSLARMDRVVAVRADHVRAEAGVSLLALAEALRPRGLFYPPESTFRGALVGGAASTNAAGAATFKYGSTRRWVRSLTVVLANGDVLDMERGECHAHADGYFEVALASGETRRVPVPSYRMPDVAKRSAGYHAEPGMDLVDLFVGAEGTLGIVTEVVLGVAPEPTRLAGWISFASEARALAAVARLRDASQATWASRDPRGVDVAAIESMDRRCLDLLREGRAHEAWGLRLPGDAEAALLFQAELPAGTTSDDVMDQAAAFGEGAAGDSPTGRLLRCLDDDDGDGAALDSLELALPGDRRRFEQLLSAREAVPEAVNQRIGILQRSGHPGVHKTAADMIVPFDRLGEMLRVYREGLGRRGLDHALWGHVSDGNLHANVIPRSESDVSLGEEAFLEFGAEAVRLGGCPLSEHGVGRSPCKQELLRRLYGDAGIEEMRRVKQALDPEWKLAPGVLFPPPSATAPSR